MLCLIYFFFFPGDLDISEISIPFKRASTLALHTLLSNRCWLEDLSMIPYISLIVPSTPKTLINQGANAHLFQLTSPESMLLQVLTETLCTLYYKEWTLVTSARKSFMLSEPMRTLECEHHT